MIVNKEEEEIIKKGITDSFIHGFKLGIAVGAIVGFGLSIVFGFILNYWGF